MLKAQLNDKAVGSIELGKTQSMMTLLRTVYK